MDSSENIHLSQAHSGHKTPRWPLLFLLGVLCIPHAVCYAPHATEVYRQVILRIQQLIQQNDLDAAATAISAALAQYPADGGLENLQGVVEIKQGHVASARAAFSQAVKHSPNLVGAYLNLARIDMQTSANEPAREMEALRLYSQVTALEPGNAEARYQEAVLYLDQQKYQRSLQALGRLNATVRGQARVQAVVYADETALGNTVAAGRAAAAMAADPDLSENDVLSLLPVLQKAHRADQIDTLLSAAERRQPLSAIGLRYLGLAEEAEGKPEEARKTLERVFATDTSSATPLMDLAQIATTSHDYKAALGYIAHAEALKPDDASLPYAFGVVCLRMNLIAAARKAFAQAVELAPQNPQYTLVLGTVLSAPEGIPYLKKYVALQPGDPEGQLALGVAYFQDNEYGSASEWLSKAAAHKRTAATALYYLGRVLLQQGKLREALAKLSLSAQEKPDQPDVLAQLGDTYMKLGEYQQAQRALAKAIQLDSNNYAANFALVRLYSRTADPRRKQQAARFQAIRKTDEEQYRDAMRAIEARPQTNSLPAH